MTMKVNILIILVYSKNLQSNDIASAELLLYYYILRKNQAVHEFYKIFPNYELLIKICSHFACRFDQTSPI